MTITSFTAAQKVCDLSGWTITNLKLQKIIYLCHLSYLGEKKKPLVDEEFEAWYYGPVLPLLYDKMKVFSNRPITDIFFNVHTDESSPEIAFIREKYRDISSRSAWDLVLMTHLKGGAWEKHFDEDQRHKKIPNFDILEEYKTFYE